MSSGLTRGSGTSTPSRSRRRSHSAYTSGVDRPVSLIAKTQWKVPAGEDRRELLPAARAHRVAAGEDEGDVAAQAGGELGELVAVEAEAPELVARDEGGRRVGRAAGHATGDGDVLVDADREALVDGPAVGDEAGGPDGEVVAVGRDAVGVRPGRR